jgi:hypothetical protein
VAELAVTPSSAKSKGDIAGANVIGLQDEWIVGLHVHLLLSGGWPFEVDSPYHQHSLP